MAITPWLDKYETWAGLTLSSLASRFRLISLQSNSIRQRLTCVCNIIISLTPGQASNVWRRDDSDDRRGSNNNIISSQPTFVSSKHLTLSCPSRPLEFRMWRVFVEGGMLPSSERKLSPDTFGNLTRVSSEICKIKYNSPRVKSSDCVSITSHKDSDPDYNPQSLVYSPRVTISQIFKIWRFILRSVSHILYPSAFKK